jgi:hypothetical protein
LAFTPHVKALRLISEFQPMRSTDFDNLKQQNGLDSSCKAALTNQDSWHYILQETLSLSTNPRISGQA